MQIVENWTDVTGKVAGVEPGEAGDGLVKVNLKVSRTHEVKGYANLLAETKGQILAVHLPQAAADELKLGDKVSCRLRRSGQQRIFAHPEQIQKAK
jgi:hypothetical protein